MTDDTKNLSGENVAHSDTWWSRIRHAAETGTEALQDGDLASACAYIDTVLAAFGGLTALRFLTTELGISFKALRMITETITNLSDSANMAPQLAIPAGLMDCMSNTARQKRFGLTEKEVEALHSAFREVGVLPWLITNVMVGLQAGEPGVAELLAGEKTAA